MNAFTLVISMFFATSAMAEVDFDGVFGQQIQWRRGPQPSQLPGQPQYPQQTSQFPQQMPQNPPHQFEPRYRPDWSYQLPNNYPNDPNNSNGYIFKNSIMQLAQEVQFRISNADVGDAELAKAQEYLMKAKNLLISDMSPNTCVTLFDGDRFTNMRLDLYPGEYLNLTRQGWNDRAQSFKLRAGCRVGLWFDKNSGGDIIYFTSSMESIPARLYRQATTVKCGCNGENF